RGAASQAVDRVDAGGMGNANAGPVNHNIIGDGRDMVPLRRGVEPVKKVAPVPQAANPNHGGRHNPVFQHVQVQPHAWADAPRLLASVGVDRADEVAQHTVQAHSKSSFSLWQPAVEGISVNDAKEIVVWLIFYPSSFLMLHSPLTTHHFRSA